MNGGGQAVIKLSQRQYNVERPHRSLRYLTPAEFGRKNDWPPDGDGQEILGLCPNVEARPPLPRGFSLSASSGQWGKERAHDRDARS